MELMNDLDNIALKMVERPKIAVLGTRGLPACWGGIERKCEEIYSRLATQGFPITIYTRPNYTQHNSLIYRGIRLKPISTIQEKHLEPFLHTFLCTLHACFSDADILHYYAQGPCLFAWIPRILAPRKKVVFSCCGLDWRRKKWGRLARRVIKIGEWLSAKVTHARISVSRAILAYYQRKYRAGMWYIPNGSIPLTAKGRATTVLSKFQLAPQRYYVFIGRLVPEKAVEELIKAYQLARMELPGIKLAIVGGTSATDGYVSELKDLAAGDPSIVFTSYIFGDALAALYANALAYVSPSYLEGLPNALLEAISYGTPPMVSDIAPHLEVVSPSEASGSPASKWVFKTGDVNQLSERLIRFHKLSSTERSRIGDETRSAVCAYYSWDLVADCHAIFYQQWRNGTVGCKPRKLYELLAYQHASESSSLSKAV